MPNLNHRFDWAGVGDKNMQISGIFSKTKLPNLMGGLCAAVLLAITPVYADTYLLDFNDYEYAKTSIGLRCSSEGKNIFFCNCLGQDPNPINVTEVCPSKNVGATISSWGCRFDGTGGTGVELFCVNGTGGKEGACTTCQCEDEISSWVSIGSNRVSRTVKRAAAFSEFECRVSSAVTEYGCAEGYYTAAATPSASMTCSRCPGLTMSSGSTRYGDSSTGNTSITGCSQPANTTFKDNVGQYQFTSECSHTK